METRAARSYTAVVSLDTLRRLIERLGSGAYDLSQVGVELLLIAMSINWLAGVLHGTRGTRLLRGLLVVVVAVTLIVRVLATQFGWARIELLYRYFLVGIGFISLVVFQPELRRALTRAGDVRLFRRDARHDTLIQGLVHAAANLSRNRHGALIAIQRDVGLANWAESGTPLHADLTGELLTSIFFPNSPLHDLGVIVRGNQLLAAGCQFPTTESGDVDPSLGSRHRAAIGLSAESDALVLVVSEETGAISLADGGRLLRFLTHEALERELRQRLDSAHSNGPMRRGGFAKDVWRFARRLLVIAPLTAIVWVLADEASLSQIENVPVTLKLTHDAGIAVDLDQGTILTVALRGPNRALDQLRIASAQRPLELEWRLNGPYAGYGRHELGEGELIELLSSLPGLSERGVYAQRAAPDKLAYSVDEVQVVSFPIEADAGTLQVADVRFEPPEAQVRIRRNDLERLTTSDRIVTAKLTDRLTGVTGDEPITLDRVALERKIDGFDMVGVNPDVVKVTLRVVAEHARTRIESVPVQILASPQFAQSFDIELRDAGEWLIDLEIEGERTRIAALRPQDVQAYVSFSSSQTPSTEFRSSEVKVLLPPGLSVVGTPPSVQYRLTLRVAPSPS